MASQRVDAKGLTCPYPLLMVQKEAKKLAPGDELVLVTDNPPTLETIPRWAEKEGHQASVHPRGPGEWEIVVRIQ
jgi:tRNA 2-thiouridine synthesizing protein A